MSADPTAPVPVPLAADPAAGTRAWPGGVRWALVVALVVSVLGTVLLSPVAVDSRHLRADLRDGEVTWLQNGCSGSVLGGPFRLGLGWFPVDAQPDDGVCWTTDAGRAYVAAIDGAGAGGAQQDDRVLRATAGREVVASSGDEPWHATVGRDAASATVLLSILLAVLMLAGPQPRRHTRWGTFWLMSVGLGLGALWWLLREAPWSRSLSATPEPRPHEVGELASGHRGGGWSMLLLSVVLSTLLWLVGGVLLDLLTPAPDGPFPWARPPR